jgi:hypothetical protein
MGVSLLTNQQRGPILLHFPHMQAAQMQKSPEKSGLFDTYAQWERKRPVSRAFYEAASSPPV